MEKKMLDVELMTLTTVHLVRKYIGILDVNFVWIDQWQAFRFDWIQAYKNLACHESQLVWFRKFFIIFSRYTYVNSFTRYVQKGAPKAAGAVTLKEDSVFNDKRMSKVNID